ncbi:Polyketide synthase enoylreductase protein [Rutstroemia sp. NJR-2017a BBW]|nr:Polyketide synthase enoylreductase protein [Rutstroemia sp. NJR-2017a BBW]
MATQTQTESQEQAIKTGKDMQFDIPKTCKAGVVVNEGAFVWQIQLHSSRELWLFKDGEKGVKGPDFHVEVQDVPVPEPGMFPSFSPQSSSSLTPLSFPSSLFTFHSNLPSGPNDLLIRLRATGLCMSDIHYMLNDWAVPPMSSFSVQCPGHEGAGIVVKVGANVTGWKVGDRAGVKPIWDVCYNCELCWEGRENYCSKAVLTGLMSTGTYQQYITSPARYTSPIPEGVNDYVAGPIMCSASTMHRALIDSRLKASQFVIFPGGGGGVGIQGVQLAKAMGMRPIVIDSGDAKRKLSLEMGAEEFVDFVAKRRKMYLNMMEIDYPSTKLQLIPPPSKTPDTATEIKRICNGIGAHGVIVTAYQAYKDAISLIGDRIGGVIVCVGLPPKEHVNLGADPSHFAFKNLHIMGSLVGTMGDTAASLEYARRGLLKQICEVRGLSRFEESVQQLRRGEVPGRIVIDFDME